MAYLHIWDTTNLESTPVSHRPLFNGDNGWILCNLSLACLHLALSLGLFRDSRQGRSWTPLVYKDGEICYNDNRVVCASRTAARCREESIDTRDPQEDPHEDH